MNPPVVILQITIEPRTDGGYLTIILFLNAKGKKDEVNRLDLHLQGCEEFIRDFRIKHNL